MKYFKLLPARNIISILKKMDARTFSRAYRTCRDMKKIADKARAEIKIELKDNNGNGFGIDFGVYAYWETFSVRIHKSIFSVYESITSQEPLQKASPQREEDLDEFLKNLSFFKWEVINIFPCGYCCYTNEETSPNPVLMYIDWIFKALKKNYIACEKLKAPPGRHIKAALNYLRVKNWHARGPSNYERERVDWISMITDTGVIERKITFSIKLWCMHLDDLPKLLNLFDYLDIAVEDAGCAGQAILYTSLAALDQRLNRLRMFPRTQEIRFSVWSPSEYPNIQPQQFLNCPFTEYSGFAEDSEIHRRGFQCDPKILRVATADRQQHLMLVMFQGRCRNEKWLNSWYLKIYCIVVNDWEKCLSEFQALFHTVDNLLPVDKDVNQFKRDFFEL